MKPYALIIEDDATLLEIFSQAIQAAGYQTSSIMQGEDGLAALKHETPNLVVLDLHLPNVSGTTILNYIRSEDRLASTWVIIASADTLMTDDLRKNDGVDFVMEKPVSFIQLSNLAARLHPNNQPKGRVTV